MELKMQPFQTPAEILFNYEEIKAELEEKLKVYSSMVYTDDQISAAKADRASLNALKKALNDERIRQQKEYMKSFDAYKAKIDELIKLIDKPVLLIDKQVKAAEEAQQNEKLEEIKKAFAALEFPDFVSLEHIFDKRWLNKSVGMKAITEAMNAEKQRIDTDLATLAEMPQFSAEALTEYKYSHDLNAAIRAAQRAAEVARMKAEQEARRKAQSEWVDVSGTVPAETATALEVIAENATTIEPTVAREWVGFQAFISTEEGKALGAWLRSNGIKYKAI